MERVLVFTLSLLVCVSVIASKNTFTEVSRTIFDQIFGQNDLAKLAHKIHHQGGQGQD